MNKPIIEYKGKQYTPGDGSEEIHPNALKWGDSPDEGFFVYVGPINSERRLDASTGAPDNRLKFWIRKPALVKKCAIKRIRKQYYFRGVRPE